jgi:hypothetical protein
MYAERAHVVAYRSWRVTRAVLAPAFVAGVVLICLVASAGAARPLRKRCCSSPPPGKIVSTVYCPNRQNVNCARVAGRGPKHYRHAPRGYDTKLRCRWYDTGFGTGLGEDKHYCVRRKKH